MNYKKISNDLYQNGYVDERMIVCHAYRSYTNTKDYYVVTKYNNFQSSFYLPSFMILSIKGDILYISYAKAFGGFKKYYASFKIKNMQFVEEITVDKVVKIYLFKIVDEHTDKVETFYVIGVKNKDRVENLVNNLIYDKSYLNDSKYDIYGIPEFDYISNDALNQIFNYNNKKQHCQCCGKVSEYLYGGPLYCEEDVERLCPECIKSGKAANDFKGTFVDIDEVKNVDKTALEILSKKTPGYDSYQDVIWNYCCKVPSEFQGIFSWEEVTTIGIEQEVKNAILENQDFIFYDVKFEEFIEILDDEAAQLVVFKCKHCNKISVQIFFD